MKKKRMTDEQMAALIDAAADIGSVLQSGITFDDLEVFSSVRQAKEMVYTSRKVEFPGFEEAACAISAPEYTNLAMAGFLGDNQSEAEYDEQTDKKTDRKDGDFFHRRGRSSM